MVEHKSKICISGIGAVTPFGSGVTEFLLGLRESRTCFQPYKGTGGCLDTVFETQAKLCGRIDGSKFERNRYFDFRKLKKRYLFEQCIINACAEALSQCDLNLKQIGRSRIGVVTGSDLYHIISLENYLAEERSEQNTPAAIANFLSLNLKLNGPSFSISAGEASSLTAMGTACDLIAHEICDMVIVGAGSQINNCLAYGLEQLELLSIEYYSEKGALNGGAVLSEGAGLIIFESSNSTQRRNGQVYGYPLGYGLHYSNNDKAFINQTQLSNSIIQAANTAISMSGIKADDIDHVIECSIRMNIVNKAEAEAFNFLFSNCASTPVKHNFTNFLGETLSAGGILSTIAATDLSLVRSDDGKPAIIMVNAASFDGNCASFIFSRLPSPVLS